MSIKDRSAEECIEGLQTDNDHLEAEVDALRYELKMAIDQIRRMQQDRECVY